LSRALTSGIDATLKKLKKIHLPFVFNSFAYVCVPTEPGKLMQISSQKPNKLCQQSYLLIYRYMAVAKTLQGTWVKEGSSYASSTHQFTLVMAERKKATENKPSRYMVIKYPDVKPQYLSGLYPTLTQGVYRIDYQGKKYTLEFLNSTQVLIKNRSI
jgi:hypothetical protein